MKCYPKFLALPLLIAGLLVSVSGRAQTLNGLDTQAWFNSPYMFGDWGGERTWLANRGVSFNFISVNDLLVNTNDQVANWSHRSRYHQHAVHRF